MIPLITGDPTLASQSIKHRTDLHHLPTKIHGTRPRWLVSFARGGPPGSVIIPGELP